MRWWARTAAVVASWPVGLRIVLLAAAVLHGIGLSWGLPSSDAWDNDGIAPRDVLPGLAETFTPGSFYTYPPAHLILLAALTAPVTLVAIVRAEALTVAAVTHEILGAPYMTAIALTARVVSLLMSLGIAVAIARIAEETSLDASRGRRAGVFAAATVSVGITFGYYAHTSNLDVPSLFWASLSALSLVRAVARRSPRRFRSAALLAAVAMATKDQTYALFVISVPVILALWVLLDPWPRQNARTVLGEAGLALALGVVALLVLDGAVFNPTGFAARLRFLRGPASQDFSNYAGNLQGRLAILLDIARSFGRHYPPVFVPILLGGVVVVARREREASRAAALLPLAMAVSFTVAFNLAARRTDDRFALPQMLMLAVYAGHALEPLASRRMGQVAIGGTFLWATWEALRVDFMLLGDPRYATEAYLREHVRPGDVIETHGKNVYLPRFPEGARVLRVGASPVGRRGPFPGFEEVQAPLMGIESRQPRFVVVSRCYVWRYLPRDPGSSEGRVYPTSQLREASDTEATTFFTSLFEGRLAYHPVHAMDILDGWFRPIEIHASLNCKVTTFERNDRR